MWYFLVGDGNFNLTGLFGGVTTRLSGGDRVGDLNLGGELDAFQYINIPLHISHKAPSHHFGIGFSPLKSSCLSVELV